MKHIALILTLLVLVGCQAPDDYQEPCGGYGCQYTDTTELGIRYRNDGGPLSTTMSEVDAAYKHTAECLGVWYEPDILFISTTKIPANAVGATIYSGDGRITIVTKPHENSLVRMSVLSHEFVHYLLYRSTGDGDGNHISPLFSLCTVIAG